MTMSKPHAVCSLLLALLIGFTRPSPCASSLYNPPLPDMTYHHGSVLDGTVPVSVLYYGAFSTHHKAVLSDFLRSLSPRSRPHAFGAPAAAASSSVAQWWETVDRYVQRTGRERTRVMLTNQVSDEGCSLGKHLSRLQVEQLAARLGVAPGGVAVVLTAADVAVDGFCGSSCGLHGSLAPGGAVHVWVGNAAVQCPGRCAWPFHAADPAVAATTVPGRHRSGEIPLRAPNGDAGVDGMVINLAALLAGAVTNPYGHRYFQGDASAPVEVGGGCPGAYGRSAYTGYPGAVKLDTATGSGYNMVGRNGWRYLVPYLVDPANYSCLIMA